MHRENPGQAQLMPAHEHEETQQKVAPKEKEEHRRTPQLEPHQEDMVTPHNNQRLRDS